MKGVIVCVAVALLLSGCSTLEGMRLDGTVKPSHDLLTRQCMQQVRNGLRGSVVFLNKPGETHIDSGPRKWLVTGRLRASGERMEYTCMWLSGVGFDWSVSAYR